MRQINVLNIQRLSAADRAKIERLVWDRVKSGNKAAFEGHTFESLLRDTAAAEG